MYIIIMVKLTSNLTIKYERKFGQINNGRWLQRITLQHPIKSIMIPKRNGCEQKSGRKTL